MANHLKPNTKYAVVPVQILVELGPEMTTMEEAIAHIQYELDIKVQSLRTKQHSTVNNMPRVVSGIAGYMITENRADVVETEDEVHVEDLFS